MRRVSLLLLLSGCMTPLPPAPACDAPAALEGVSAQLTAPWLVNKVQTARAAGDTDVPEVDLHAATVSHIRDVDATRANALTGFTLRVCAGDAALPGEAPRPIAWSIQTMGDLPRWPWEGPYIVGPLIWVCDATKDATAPPCERRYIGEEVWRKVWPQVVRPAETAER